jgi:RES domain-containing protein
MWVYRLAKTKYADSGFSGVGAKLTGGRWNSEGVACVYGTQSEAQAVLEVLVHLQNAAPLEAYSFTRIKLHDSDLLQLEGHSLPKGWNAPEGSRAARTLGDGWLDSGGSLALMVPSVLTKHEQNILINPEHPDLQKRLQTVQSWPYSFDQRLYTPG